MLKLTEIYEVTMKIANGWQDYEVLATGDGKKIENWNGHVLVRPDPQVIWGGLENRRKPYEKLIAAEYQRSSSGGGCWEEKKKLPSQWLCTWKNLKFIVKPMGFKHTGIFPEQATNWERMQTLIKNSGREIKILNLFAYTGCASVACAAAGGKVTHVDASKGMVERAKENARLNGITDIRFIVDDCQKFIEREIRRGNRYDAIIMDPPSYGRGPSGEMWKIEDNLFDFIGLCKQVLSDNPLFVLVNSYTTGLQAGVIKNMLALTFGIEGTEADEIGLPTKEGIVLPCGNSGFKIW